jgi:hypothetical protein
MECETRKVRREDGVLFAEIAAPPMNLEGVSRDGSHLFPVSSYDHFTKLSAVAFLNRRKDAVAFKSWCLEVPD